MTERYQTALGKRHKFLREEVLKLNLRTMATLYGMPKVATLEDCEAGLDEFPKNSMQQLEDYFFIRREYIEEGTTPRFRTFLLSRESCLDLLKAGFSPYVLTTADEPERRAAMPFHILFCKEERGMWRSVQADRSGYFMSTGGGKHNGVCLISALRDFGKTASAVSFLRCGKDHWQKLESFEGYYNISMYGFAGMADYHAHDLFDEWYNEYNTSCKQWEGMMKSRKNTETGGSASESNKLPLTQTVETEDVENHSETMIQARQGPNAMPIMLTGINSQVQKTHFEDFSGHQFERLVLAYALRGEWTDAEWIGEVGADGGRDILCSERDGSTTVIACANFKQLTIAKVVSDLKKISTNQGSLPNQVIVVGGGQVSAALRAKIKEAATALGFKKCRVWSGVELEERIRRENEHLLERFCHGVPFPETKAELGQLAIGKRSQ